MEKIMVFLDYANINRAASSRGLALNYKNLLDYLAEGRFLVDAYCYVPIDPRNEHEMDNEIRQLWSDNYLVTNKTGVISGDTYKCNFDVEMTIDIMRMAHEVKPDIVVIATGDVDFLPVVTELRKLGIRVEVACFGWATSQNLLLRCSDFIDLAVYYQQNYPSLMAEEQVHQSEALLLETPEQDETENQDQE